MRKIILFLIFINSFVLSQSPGVYESLNKHIKYSDSEVNKIGYLSIEMEHPIDQSTFIQAKFAIEKFKKEEVIFVLLNLNTPGGQVYAAQKISELLRKLDLENGISVVAFLNNWAVSAGAMLSYACRYIAITPYSIMGAAEPVIASGSEMKQASEKVNSALRAEFMNLAETYNRNPDIAEAMVDKDVTLVYRNSQVVKLQSENQIKSSDEIISNKKKLLTLNSNALRKYNVADIYVPFQKKLNGKALDLENISTLFQQDFFKNIPNKQIITYKDWKVSFFSFLSHPIVASLLVMGMLLGFYIEINTPGFGIFGGIATTCFVLIILNSLAIQAVNWLELIILFAGILLITIEFLVIPGFGFVGILGIALMIIGLFMFMVPNIKEITFDPEKISLKAISATNKLAWLLGSLLITGFVAFLMSKYVLPRFNFFSRIVLKGEQEGYISGLPKEKLPKINDEGIAYTPLRPSGKIIISDEFFDASSERNFIEKDEIIIVTNIIGNRIIVRKK
jgi:membrane-bound serine protease (ClpP class)